MKKLTLYLFLLVFLQTTANAQLFINEFMAKNATTIADDFGEYDDWVEIYNAGTEAVDIGGYYISDQWSDFPDYYQIPTGNAGTTTIAPGGFLLIWADKDSEQGPLHTDFKLSGNGEFLALFSDTQVLLDSFSFGPQISDISMGRAPNGSDNMVFFQPSTPLADNPLTGFSDIVNPPEFSVPGGFYEDEVVLTLTTDEPGATIYYTSDGSDPDVNSTQYTAPIHIATTTVIRAVTVKAGSLPSFPASNTYFFDQHYTLPVLEVTTDPDNMWGDLGIYSHPHQSGSEWERFCQPSFFVDEALAFSANCGIRIQGNSSVTMPKKSFRLYFKNQYGQPRLEYPLFGDNDGVTDFKNIVLKSGYDDDITIPGGTLLRDPMGWRFYKKTGGLVANGRWSILTINSDYWGIYELRESVNEYFIEDHTGFNDFDMIRFKTEGFSLKHGSMDDWNELDDFIKTHDLSVSSNYAFVEERMDMDNMINLMAFIQSTDYRSWGRGVTTYKENVEGGKWQWTIWDMDRSFSSRYVNMLDWWMTSNLDGLYWSNYIPRALLANEGFQRKLANREADLLNTVFKPDNSLADLAEQKAAILPEMPGEFARWNDTMTVSLWEEYVMNIHLFLDKRPGIIRSHIVDFFEYDGQDTLTLNVVGQGSLHINTIDVPEYPWTGVYFQGNPVTVTATPDVGYSFAGWSDGSLPVTNQVTFDIADIDDLTAIFEPSAPSECSGVTVSEIMYHPSANNTGDEWVELYNSSGEDKDISGWILKDDSDTHEFVVPGGTTIPVGGYLVIAKDVVQFSNFYTDVTNAIGNYGDGANGFGLSNAADEIRLYNESGCLVDSVAYTDSAPWYVEADGAGRSLALIDVNGSNSLPQNWKASDILNGMPGRPNILTVELGEDVTTCAGANITVEAQVPGCTDCDFLWENGDTSAQHVVSPVNTMTVTLTVTSGDAIATGEMTINVDNSTAPQLAVTATDVTCYGADDGTITTTVISGTPPLTYTWTGGLSGTGGDQLPAGEYALTVTDESGCSNSYEMTIEEPELLTSSEVSINPTDNNHDGSITVTPDGGTPPYVITWDNGANSFEITGLAPGTYSYTVADVNGCFVTGEVMLTAIISENCAGIIFSEIMYHPAGDNTGGDWVELYNTADTVRDISGWILKDDGDDHEFVLPDGTLIPPAGYFVVSGDLDDFASFYTDVSNVAGSFGAGDTGFGLGNGGDAVRLFTAAGCLVDSVSFDDVAPWDTLADGGGRSLELTCTTCDNSLPQNWKASGIINGMPGRPNTLHAIILGNQVVCPGGNVHLEVNVPGCTACEYLWNNGATTDSTDMVYEETGNAFVTVTSGDTSVTANLVIIIDTSLIPGLESEVTPVSCYGAGDGSISTTVIAGSTPFVYTWSTGAESSDLENLDAGHYALTVVDEMGCTNDFEYEVGTPLPLDATITIQNPTEGNSDGEIAIDYITGGTSPFTIHWSTGSEEFTLSGLEEGSYSFVLEDAHGCSLSDTISLISTGIDGIPGLKGLTLFPNPNNGQFAIDWQFNSVDEEASFIIRNVLGQVVWQKEASLSSGKMKVDVFVTSPVSKKGVSGLYLLEITTGKGKIVRRILVKE